MRTVLIYRNELLHLSETFIAAQTNALTRYHPLLVSPSRVANSLPLPPDAILLTRNRSRLSRIHAQLYQRTGIAPLYHARLRGSGATLIHAHFAVDAAAALPLAARLRIPLIATLHGYDVTTADEQLAQSAEGALYLKRRQQLFRHASLFLCTSDYIRRRALARGFPPGKLRTHYIGVDCSKLHPPRKERHSGLVLFVGRLVEVKGVDYLLRAMRIVQEIHPESQLVLIGDGPLRPALTARAAEMQVRSRFLGAQPQAAVRQWMAQATALCLPSVRAASGAVEGLGLVLLEAQAMGLPVVGSDIGGIPEVVQDGITGLLAPEQDFVAMARALLQLLESERLRRQLTQAARGRVMEYFNLERQTLLLQDIYDEITAESLRLARGRR